MNTPETISSTASAEPTSLALRIGNLCPSDAQFIRNVVAIFCDPAYADQADLLRNNHLCLVMEANGALVVHRYNPNPKIYHHERN